MAKIESTNDYRFEVIGEGALQELVIFYILSGEEEERKYGIPVLGIGNVLKDSLESEWVHQLYNKLWVSVDMLYDLAKEVQKLSPENDIDWIKTFFMVEKYNYLKANTEDENDSDSPVSGFARVRAEIDLSHKLANDPEFNNKLTEEVAERLKSERLL